MAKTGKYIVFVLEEGHKLLLLLFNFLLTNINQFAVL